MCADVTLAPVRYSVYLVPLGATVCRDAPCPAQVPTIFTHGTRVTVSGLTPFTKYVVRLRLVNYYSAKEQTLPIGPPVVFSTKFAG